MAERVFRRLVLLLGLNLVIRPEEEHFGWDGIPGAFRPVRPGGRRPFGAGLERSSVLSSPAKKTSMATSSFLHPSLGFLILAVLLPFLPGPAMKWLLLVPPIVALWSVFSVAPGVYAVIPYLGEQVTLGRVDSLSLIFAQVFAVMSLIGMTYALNVEDKGSHIAASLYVAGSFGSVFAGDYLSLFVFWELMSIGSTFLIFLNRTRESTLAGFRYFLYHTVGGLFLLGGLLLRHQATGSFAFDHILPESAACYDWLILAGFCVNAAVVPLHAWLPRRLSAGHRVRRGVHVRLHHQNRRLCPGPRLRRLGSPGGGRCGDGGLRCRPRHHRQQRPARAGL